MLDWANWEYYAQAYSGGNPPQIEQPGFTHLCKKACAIVNRYTFNQIPATNPADCVKDCVCALAEAIQTNTKSDAETGNVTSEHVGDLSLSYASLTDRKSAYANQIMDIVYTYLCNTGYLYAGVR